MTSLPSTYFYINNIKINNIEKNRNIIDYLESLGIKIPHFCYHQKLSVAGNCRMCLIELKNSPKPIVACAMTVTNKMEIFTNSSLVKKARENVMEFLLLNHPLDCPICDQGGECDLQDQSMNFGTTKKRFYGYKRSVTNKNLGPLIKTVMTRCIHCTKCVRFSSEIAGVDDLGMFGRGNSSEIGTYVSKVFNSELSGNVIDICPVGALTNKPYSFADRSWELVNVKSIDFTDGNASNVIISTKSESIVTKVQPAYDNLSRTNLWISDKTRFSFDGMFSSERNTLIATYNKAKQANSNSWDYIFAEILKLMYFEKHLQLYSRKNLSLTILIEAFLNAELLCVLYMLKTKYKFVDVLTTNNNTKLLDLDSLLYGDHLGKTDSILADYDTCVLIGINTRLEATWFNLYLRQRFSKGNFKIYTIGSAVDITIPTNYLGYTFKNLDEISSGHSFICKEFSSSKSILFLYNPNTFDNNQSKSFLNFYKIVKSMLVKCNFLPIHLSLNSSTHGYFNFFDSASKLAFNNLFCIGTDFKTPKLSKLVELNLLFKTNQFTPGIFASDTFDSPKNYSSKVLLNRVISLPSKTFFETNGKFFNTQGILKKSVKALSAPAKARSSFQIVKRLVNGLETTEHLITNSRISFKTSDFAALWRFISCNFLASSSLARTKALILHNKNRVSMLKTDCKVLNLKNKNTAFKLNYFINDFYVNRFNLYSNYSKVMSECSKSNRFQQTNFIYLF